MVCLGTRPIHTRVCRESSRWISVLPSQSLRILRTKVLFFYFQLGAHESRILIMRRAGIRRVYQGLVCAGCSANSIVLSDTIAGTPRAACSDLPPRESTAKRVFTSTALGFSHRWAIVFYYDRECPPSDRSRYGTASSSARR